MIMLVLIIPLLIIYGSYKRKQREKAGDLARYRTAVYSREAAQVKKERERERKRKTQLAQALNDIQYYQSKKEELTQLLEITTAKLERQYKKLENLYNKRGAITEKVIEKDIKEYERLKRQVITLKGQLYTCENRIIKARGIKAREV